VKSTRANPIEWWMVGQRAVKTVQALAAFKGAVLDQELSYDGGLYLTSHLLHARMVASRTGTQIAKAHPDSEDKIDAAVAAVLAYQARLDAIAAGALKTKKKRRTQPRRLR
jgi:phage terminase large subunit-like protein